MDTTDATTTPAPALLGDAPPTELEIADGTVWPASEVRRFIGRTWRAARKLYERKLEAQLARMRAEFEAEFEAKRSDLTREVALTTRELLAQEWKTTWQEKT